MPPVSRTFSNKLPLKSHIVRGTGGVQAEIGYMQDAVDAAFFELETTGQLALYRIDTVDPTVNDDATQGFTKFSRWINLTSPRREFVLLNEAVGAADWKETTSVGGGGGAVSSVFGRTGNVTAAAGDYVASQVNNDSNVPGLTVEDALDYLLVSIPPASTVFSVFGRTGNITALSGDYAASLVTNDSSVSGATVAAALNTLNATKVPDTRNVLAGPGLLGGGPLSSDVTLRVGPHPDGSIVVGTGTVRVGVLASDLSHGNRGGGGLHADATITVSGFLSATDKVKLNAIEAGAEVNDVFSVFGRVGDVVAVAGDYAASYITNDSAAPGATVKDALDALATPYTSSDGSIVISGTDLTVGVLATDTQHGIRGGGGLHANATTLAAGFMSALDKTKLNALNWDVKVSSNDSTTGYLVTKLVAGLGVVLTELNDGSSETFEISAPGAAGLDQYVRVSATDTTSGHLNSKLEAGRNVRLPVLNPGGNEELRIETNRVRVRNETGATISALTMVAPIGFNTLENAILVATADKDTAQSVALGVLLTTLANNTTGDALIGGELTPIDTSGFSLGDILVLGDAGQFDIAPPGNPSFTGTVQAVGKVTRVHATDGIVQLNFESVFPLSSDGIYDLEDSLERGVQSGFVVTRGGGRLIDVTSGVGFVESAGVLTRIVFLGDTILLPADASRYIYVDDNGVLQATTSMPSLPQTLLLATAHTDTTDVVLLSTYQVSTQNVHQQDYLFRLEAMGVVTVSGGETTVSGGGDPLRLSVTAATFYLADNRKSVPATTSITFAVWYQDGLGDWELVSGVTNIDPNTYDNGSGTLVAVPAGEWKKDALYLADNNDGTGVEYHLVVAQATYPTQQDAEEAAIPFPPPDLAQFSLRLAGVISQEGASIIASITDERPFIGQSSSTSGGGGSGVHETLRQLIHLADGGGPFEGFATGAYEEYLPAADPFPTSAIWWTDSGKTSKIVEQTVTYNGNKTINTSEWKAYDVDGTTVLSTVTDTFAYSGIFELSRTRAIA